MKNYYYKFILMKNHYIKIKQLLNKIIHVSWNIFLNQLKFTDGIN